MSMMRPYRYCLGVVALALGLLPAVEAFAGGQTAPACLVSSAPPGGTSVKLRGTMAIDITDLKLYPTPSTFDVVLRLQVDKANTEPAWFRTKFQLGLVDSSLL